MGWLQNRRAGHGDNRVAKRRRVRRLLSRHRRSTEREEDLPPSAEPPYFRITGRAIMGSIKVMGR